MADYILFGVNCMPDRFRLIQEANISVKRQDSLENSGSTTTCADDEDWFVNILQLWEMQAGL